MAKYSGLIISLTVSLLCIGCFKENPWESATDTASNTDSQTGSDTATDTVTASGSDTSSDTATPTDSGSGADSTDSADTVTDTDTGTNTDWIDTGVDTSVDPDISSDSDVVPAALSIDVVTGLGDSVIGTISEGVFAVSNMTEKSRAQSFSLSVSPENAAFSVVSTTCDTPLNTGESCGFTVRFEPTARGLKSAAVMVRYHNGVEAASIAVPVTGTGLDAARLTASSATHNYGVVFMYEKAETTLTIANNALDSSATDIELMVDNADFSLAHDCDTLAPGDACDVDVIFSPSLLTEINGTLTVNYHNGATTASTTIDLRGEGADRCAGPIEFPDANLEAAIRGALTSSGASPGVEIFGTDVSGLTELDASYREISDVRGVQCLTNLDFLTFYYNSIEDISPLAALVNLTNVSLFFNEIVDLSPLISLTKLTSITIVSNRITDISPLSSLTNLTFVNAAGNNIVDISPLAPLTNLETLYITTNSITDITPLVTNTGLDSGDSVDIKANPIDCTSAATQAAIEELLNRGVNLTHDCN